MARCVFVAEKGEGTMDARRFSFAVLAAAFAVWACEDATPVDTSGFPFPEFAITTTTSTTGFEMTQLGGFPGGNTRWAFGVNQAGHVVGLADRYDDRSPAFLWTERDGITDLGVLDGGWWAEAQDINSRDQVVGSSHPPRPADRLAFIWTTKDGLRSLGTLGGSRSEAFGINERGQVVGWSYLPGDWDRAFLWTEKEGMRNLGTLRGGSWSWGLGVNNRGQITGWSYVEGDLAWHAFLWTEQNGMTDLGAIVGQNSEGMAINNRGDIVGRTGPIGDIRDDPGNPQGEFHAFLWRDKDGMTDLGTFGAWSSAQDINERGEVVGYSYYGDYVHPGDCHAFLWTEKDGMVDLGTLPGFSTSVAYAINSSGDVVGWAGHFGEWYAVTWKIPSGGK
jgi:probable HAF family extracellular repeat protein